MRLHSERLDVVPLGRLNDGVAEKVVGDADLLGRAVDQLGHGAVAEEVGPNMPAEGVLGVDFDLLPGRPAAHRPAVAIEPGVIPFTDRGVAACKRLHDGRCAGASPRAGNSWRRPRG
jgi:hypothetical protein